MTLTDRILQWRKRRAIKRHKPKTYFKIVGQIAKRQADREVKEKLSRQMEWDKKFKKVKTVQMTLSEVPNELALKVAEKAAQRKPD